MPFIWARKKIHRKDIIEHFFSLFQNSLKPWKSVPIYHIHFSFFYMKKTKKWYNPKNEQRAKHSIFFLRDYSTWVTFEQSTSASSHPWSIYWSSVPLHFQSWPQILYSFPWLFIFQHWWRSYVTCYVIAYESLLFWNLCCPCHFCVVLLFKGSCHLSQFLYIPLDLSYESNWSCKCQYYLCPKSHQFILVQHSCWMMEDTSMSSFQ